MGAIKNNNPDLLCSFIFVAIGVATLVASTTLAVGNLAMMGPGFMPIAISIVVIAIGLVVGIAAISRNPEAISPIRLRPLLTLLLVVGGFAFGAEFLGFVITSAGLVFFGSMADRDWRLKEALISSLVLTAFGVLVFIKGLDVQMQLGLF